MMDYKLSVDNSNNNNGLVRSEQKCIMEDLSPEGVSYSTSTAL